MTRYEKRFMVVILLVSSLLTPTMALTPLLPNIQHAFPQATEIQVQLVMTLPSFTALLAMLITPYLAKKLSMELLLQQFLALELVGGLLPVFLHNNLVQVYFSSALLGFGMGGITIVAPVLVNERFSDSVKGTVLGYQSSAVGLGATLLGLLSGFWGRGNWYRGYLSFLIFLPVLLVAILFFRKEEYCEVSATQEEPETQAAVSGQLPLRVVVLSILAGLLCLFILAYPTNVASYIARKGWGGTDTAGVASALYTIGMIASGFIFGKVYRLTKQYVLIFAVGMSLSGMLLVWWGISLPVMLLGGGMIGFSYATIQAGGLAVVPVGLSPEGKTKAISLLSICVALGNSASPLVVTGLSDQIQGDLRVRFMIAIVAFLIILPLLFGTLRKQPSLELDIG